MLEISWQLCCSDGSVAENTMVSMVFSTVEPQIKASANILDAHTVLEGTAIGSFINQAEKKAPSCLARIDARTILYEGVSRCCIKEGFERADALPPESRKRERQSCPN